MKKALKQGKSVTAELSFAFSDAAGNELIEPATVQVDVMRREVATGARASYLALNDLELGARDGRRSRHRGRLGLKHGKLLRRRGR